MNAITRTRPAVTPLSPSIGADIEGIDLSRPLDAPDLQFVLDAWTHHLVLRFRGQKLTDPQLERFSAQLGTLDKAPPYTQGVRTHIESDFVTVISNVIENGRPIGDLGDGEARWHTDMSYVEKPPMASALYALEVPARGGNTGFCNMYAAYDTLEEPLKRRIAKLQCKHDMSRNSGGGKRSGYEADYTARTAPGALHPLVRIHPASGRPALFLGRRNFADIPSLPEAESEAVLDQLWKQATDPRHTWYQEWQVGDLVLWDNRCVMHRRDAFDSNQRRVMHRTQIAGERPIPA
jgi:taurine dioxygenase